MYYILESDKLSKWYNFFCRIILERNIIKVPTIPKLNIIIKEDGHKIAKKKDVDYRNKKIKQTACKTIKLLNKANSKKIVLSKNLNRIDEFKNYLYSENFNIINGKFLFSLLALEVLEYIINKKEIETEALKIAILSNDLNEIVLGNIDKIVRKYKDVTVVTRHVSKLRKFQKKLYEEEGIVFALSNNKRKSISKTNIILNFDFPEELINKFSIYDKSVVVNFSNKVKILKKRFNGTNISNFEINCSKEKLEDLVGIDKELIENFYIKDIYEAHLYKRQSFVNLRKNIKDDKVKIKYLEGNKIKY